MIVRLFSAASDSGAERIMVDGDAKGNFYTSRDPGLTALLFPTVTTSGGHVSRMLEPISKGACNSCHGVTTGRILVH